MANPRLKIQNSRFKKLWVAVCILVLLAPAGLILPEFFRAGGAWGEWSPDKIKELAGYVPEGMRKISGLWSAPLAAYTLTGWDRGIKSYIIYIISGGVGVFAVAASAYILAKILSRSAK